MLLTYIILALSAAFTPVAHARPAAAAGVARTQATDFAEPSSLLGRHYSVQERRQSSTAPEPMDATHPDPQSANVPRRLVPYAKYLADRSDETWLRLRERRADAADGDVNYLSNVSAYSAPRPYARPAVAPPPVQPATPPVAVRPPPAPAPPNVLPNAPMTSGDVKSKPGKDAQKKHASKTKMTKMKEKAHRAGHQARADESLA